MKQIIIPKTAFSFLIIFLFFGLSLNGQVTYVVNTTDDLDDDVCDELHCSFREALNASNSDGVSSNIHFNIPGNGVHVLKKNTLDFDPFWLILASNTTIDGTTQPGNSPMQGLIRMEDSSGFDFTLLEILDSNTVIKGIHFVGTNGGAIIGTTKKNLVLKDNYFNNPNKYLFIDLGDNIVSNTVFEDNYFYGMEALVQIESGSYGYFEDAILENNYFGLSPSGDISPVKNGANKIRGDFKENEFHHGSYGIKDADYAIVKQNIFFCNEQPLVSYKEPPIIGTITSVSIFGGSAIGDTIEIYKVIDTNCPTATCQGGEYLGKVSTDNEGRWSFPTPGILELGDKITALGISKKDNGTSSFSRCKIYQISNNIPTTYVVNTTDDIDDGSCNGVHCSLREAINASNIDTRPSNIHFNISGTGPFLITLNDNLQTSNALVITEDDTTIDGTTQSDNAPMNGLIQIQNTFNLSFDITGNNTVLKGLDFQPNGVHSQLKVYAYNCSLVNNYFTNPNSYVFDVTPRAAFTLIENNYFYDLEAIFVHTSEFNWLANTFFIDNIVGLSPTKEIKPLEIGLELPGQDMTIIGNEFHYCRYGVSISPSIALVKSNLFFCNENSGNSRSSNTTPIITLTAIDSIRGSGIAGDSIEIYKVIDSSCPDIGCQGGQILGTVLVKPDGTWSFSTPSTVKKFDRIVAQAFNIPKHYSSGFSDCVAYLPPVTYVVNTTDDLDDGICDNLHCSFREALNANNSDGVASNIHFNIPATGIQEIKSTNNTTLWSIEEANTVIDGTTQPGNSPMLGLIRLGATNEVNSYLLAINSPYNTIKGIHFSGDHEFPLINISGSTAYTDNDSLTFKYNYFSNPRSYFFDIAPTTPSSIKTIVPNAQFKNNYFYDAESIAERYDWESDFTNTIFMNNNIGISPLGEIEPLNYAITSDLGGQVIANNFHHCQIAISSGYGVEARENLFFCNNSAIAVGISESPIIHTITKDSIWGIGKVNDTIEIYKVVDDSCPDATCQGGLYLGKTVVDSTKNWYFPTPASLVLGNKVTVLARDSYDYRDISVFSPCKAYLDLANTTPITYTVNTIEDKDDGVCDEVHCSLREAVNASNADQVPSNIHFNLQGAGPFLITLDTLLTNNSLTITEEYTTIDGTTQTGNSPMQGLIQIQNSTKLTFNITANNTIINGLDFQPNGTHSQLSVFAFNCSLTNNYFTNPSSHVFDVTPRAAFMLIKGNYFYDLEAIFVHTSEFNWLANTFFLDNIIGLSPTKEIKPLDLGLELPGQDMTIIGNEFHYCRYGVSISQSINLAKSNLFFCNGESGYMGSSFNPAPIITVISIDSISGTGVAGDSVEIYKVIDSLCPDIQCQGGEILGTVLVNPDGAWGFPTPPTIQLFDRLTASAFNVQNHSSTGFGTCKIVLPTDCELAEPLIMNESPCSGVGTILDLDQMNPSPSRLSPSICAPTNQGNEAWFSVEVPTSGNFLVRTNVTNTVVPVIEIYTDCQTNPLPECEVLDTVPYVMFFENYTPGDILYLRVWDKNNEVVNDEVVPAFLHLTAHELDLDKSKWEICDYENLISDNPTNLVRREAATFILDYEPNTPQSEIDQNTAELIEEGLELQKECYCGHAPIQLWGTDNPVDLDDRRRGARRRACVDTTNYNYIFETVEFQVNSYAIGQQHDTDIAMDSEGNFLMVWKDEQRRHNYGRAYLSSGNPISVEFPIGSSDKTQFASKVAMLPNGDFMVVWHEINPVESSSRALIYGRLFDANGLPKGAAFNISTPAATTASSTAIAEIAKYGTNPQIGVAANGNFVVVWHVDRNIFAQRFEETGNMLGNLIEVETSFESNYEPSPSISLNDSGAFIITWTGKDVDETGIYGQQFSPNGSKIGFSFLINTTQTKEQTRADVILKNDGAFIVVWESFEQVNNTASHDIYGQQFAVDASKIGSEFLINSYTTNAQSRPSISLFNNGNFLVAWNSYEQDGFAEGIYAKLFDATANPIVPSFDDSDKGSVGEEFRMNTYADPQQKKPQTATNGETVFMGAWEDGANDGSFEGIFAQRYENILIGDNNIFYPIGTATPSTLLGDELIYPTTPYNPSNTDKIVKVAILDTGIDHNHALIQNAIWNNPEANDGDNCLFEDEIGYDFINDIGTPIDLDGHGTQINGMLTRDFDSNVKLELMNLKFHELDRGSVFDAICGIYYAVDNGANVLNLSWGFEAPEEPVVLKKALQYAADHDVLIVTTAGNTSKNNDRINKYPANLDISNMIVVTAYEYKEQTGAIKLANYASHGQTNVDIAAYGFVETARRGGTKTLAAGTSMAAPAVARTAATIKGLYPDLMATEIKDCILSTVTTVSSLSDKVATGGILDHNAALDCAADKAISGCRTNLILDNLVLDSKTYQSNNCLKSTAIIEKDSTVIFTANSFISLSPGFHAKAESDFTAKIEGCSMDLLPPSTDDVLFSTINSTKELPIKTNIYPNPAKDRVYISLQKETLGFDLALFNVIGQQIATQSSHTNQTYLEINHLPTGIYFLRINNTLTERLVIGEN